MFGLFRKQKRRTVDFSNSAESNMVNPTDFFANTGSVGKQLWQYMIDGQNEAVDIFENYTAFITDLKKRYEKKDFNRVISADFLAPLTPSAGEIMYLLLLDLDESVFITTWSNPNQIVRLSDEEAYYGILDLLTSDERAFVSELDAYLQDSIIDRVNETSQLMYGIDMCKTALPINSMELVKYHKYLAINDLYSDDNPYRKWNRISRAPLFPFKISDKDNPIVLSSLEHTDAPILDYICFATMAAPTRDLDKLLQVAGDDGVTVLQTMIKTFGTGVDKFIYKSITELNCDAFRSYARMDLKIE